jgi:hypothetical protein
MLVQLTRRRKVFTAKIQNAEFVERMMFRRDPSNFGDNSMRLMPSLEVAIMKWLSANATASIVVHEANKALFSL